MNIRIATALAMASTLLLASGNAALADRDPTPEERASIEEVLRAEGFTRWDDIEWDDDGYWEVDDAVGADGREYDLKLDANLAIIERKED